MRTSNDARLHEEFYVHSVQEALEEAANLGAADIVVGIPFGREADTVGHVITTAQRGLELFYPNKKCVIVCVGDVSAGETLAAINSIQMDEAISRISFLMKGKNVSGRGWSLRAIMDIASKLNADLIAFEADLRTRHRETGIEGMSPDWVRLLLDPIEKHNLDIAISRFGRHAFEMPVGRLLAYPLISGTYSLKLHDPLGTEFAISNKLLDAYLEDPDIWITGVGGYGVDVWLITTAIARGAAICEVDLGLRIHKSSPGKQERVVREVAEALFERIATHRDWWQEKGEILETANVFGWRGDWNLPKAWLDPSLLIWKYKRGFNESAHAVCERILPPDIYSALDILAQTDDRDFDMPPGLWARIVYGFAFAFRFTKDFAKEDILSAFVPLYQGRLASFVKQVESLQQRLQKMPHSEARHIANLQAESWIEEQLNEFIKERPLFADRWLQREECLEPVLPKVTYREFIPGVALVMPHEITSQTGKVARVDETYKNILDQLKQEFDEFVYERLSVPRDADSFEIAHEIRSLMYHVEKDLDNLLLPGELSTLEGTRAVVEAIAQSFPQEDIFALRPDVCLWLLQQFPPPNLLIKSNSRSLAQLEAKYSPNDIIALSLLSEEREYQERVWGSIRDNARPEHFTTCSLSPLVVSHADFPMLVETKEGSALCKLSGRIVAATLPKGTGGDFPKTRYLTRIAKYIVEEERFGQLWKEFAKERKEFGRKVMNSLLGHWGRHLLSAHNMFEDKNQRIMAQRLGDMADKLEKAGQFLRLSTSLKDVAASYHLAWTMSDGRFIPCSCWTWSSYSFKGGSGFPTPLSLNVERDWTSREFVTRLFETLGGTEEKLDAKIMELMGQGRESEDLSRIILPLGRDMARVSPTDTVATRQTIAWELKRFPGNPILSPIEDHPWESKFVFNPGILRIGDKIYILYRAFGDDEISRIGLAITSDGLHVDERLPDPIFQPATEEENMGCEDPRLTIIGNQIYMLYTAYSDIAAQIAMASIGINDFLHRRWNRWKRHGPAFPGFADKDAVLFPEMVGGRYVMYHRVEPSVWASFSPELECPWPRKGHKILLGPRAGMVWDGMKIGAGAQPIKTRYGWLLICHGVDYALVYRLGVLLTDLEEPSKILYRSPNPILEPREIYEIGEKDKSWVPNVVFTCGAIPREDKEILDAEDEVLVYYGGADTVTCVAFATIAKLIPQDIRVKLVPAMSQRS